MGSLNLPENLGGVAKAGFTSEEDKGQLCPPLMVLVVPGLQGSYV